MTTLKMEKQITVPQIAEMLKIEPSAFMLIEEMETVLGTQNEMNKFIVDTIGYDCKIHGERRQVGSILSKLRLQKMKEYTLTLIDFVEWFEVDSMGALSHLLVEKIKPIHIKRISEYDVTPKQIYEMHINFPSEYLFGLLHRM